MLNKITPIIILGLILAACGKTDDHAGHNHAMADMKKETNAKVEETERVIYYTCPMDEHKHVHAREPGNCTECGMAMVAGVITSEEKMEYWGCPMEAHAHVRLDAAGTCEDCGMQLKPMRLKKS